MTPEEYERIKEAEKQHLQAIRKLKEKLRQVESGNSARAKQSRLQKAIDEIENAPGDDILNTHEEMIDRLAMEAIHQEARIELALSSQNDGLVESDPSEEEVNVQSDEELQQIRAKELVRKMKIQMGLDNLRRKQEPVQNVTKESHSESGSTASVNESESESEEEAPLPDKTIGRIPKK